MNKKRFTIADYPTDIIDNQSGKKYPCSSYGTHMEIICDLLNELNDENEQLRLQLNLCSDQRNEFHRGVRENANRVGKLEKENEQLRKQLQNFQ